MDFDDFGPIMMSVVFGIMVASVLVGLFWAAILDGREQDRLARAWTED